MLLARDYHSRHSCRPVFRLGLHFIFALMLIAGAGGVWKGGEMLTFSVVLLAGGIYWFFFRRSERNWIIRRQFAKRPDRNMEMEWKIEAAKIWTHSSLGQSEFTWELFVKMVRTPEGVLFYPNDQVFHWLPRSGFVSDEEFARLVALGKTKIPRHYEVH